MDKYWYKNAIIYCLDVHTFKDGNGDGIGDFQGAAEKLDYLADLGVTCIWLTPFFPTPDRDNGYDVRDYYGVDPRFGTLDDFLNFLHQASERGIQIMLDLVVNHTSDQHPWFQASRRNLHSRYRDYYVWTSSPPPVQQGKGPIFPGESATVWTYDEIGQAYYYHRFHDFQPGLNIANPEVRQEILQIMDFWMAMGVIAFRIDAAAIMVQKKGIDAAKPQDPHEVLKEMRRFAASRREEAVLLGEANVRSELISTYFGDGDELNMIFNFMLDSHIFLSLVRGEADPIIRALNLLPAIPQEGEWANFLRNLDELDLEHLSSSGQQEVFDALAPEGCERIFGRGIRRRLAPLLGGDRCKLELVFSLLFSLPGVPLLVYGDEIGMGDDLALPGRAAVRTPMQWSDQKNAGFSSAPEKNLVRPVIARGEYSYHRINVQQQQQETDSFLNWVKHLIWTRRQCPDFGWGTWRIIQPVPLPLLVHRCEWKNGLLLATHNLSGKPTEIELDMDELNGRPLVDLLDNGAAEPIGRNHYRIRLDGYGYHWYRAGERPDMA